MVVTVFGASSCELRQIYYDAAFEAGAMLARRGHTMVYGGGASGLMGAAARGVTSEGGKLVGVAPRFFDQPGILYEGNTEMIFTDTMGERKKLMEDMAEAFLTLPGGIGTFEEFFEALTLKQLGRHAKAMAVYNVDGCYDALDAMMRRSVEEHFTPADGYALYRSFTQLTPMLDYLESYEAQPAEVWMEKIFKKKYPGEG
jgi:uncharacterized protein (TIGR00730 family)